MNNYLVKFVGNYINALSYISKPYAARKALDLFMTPRRGKLNKVQSNFLRTAEQEDLTYKEFSVKTYRWPGSKQTILLAHGWESNSARWQSLITTFQQGDFNIIALDAPAHGASGGKTFDAILYAEFMHVVITKFPPNIIVGHSVGGMAAAYLLHKYASIQPQKIILLGAPSEFTGLMKSYTDMLGYNKQIVLKLQHTISNRFDISTDNFSTARFASSLKTEALIIHDKHDRVIPYNEALRINAGFKKSHLISTEGLGHSLNHPLVTKHIRTFIDS